MKLPTPRAELYWGVLVPNWKDLPGADQRICADIVSDYGGTLASGQTWFRRYRSAEACALSLRSKLGVGVTPGFHLAVDRPTQ